MSSFADHDVIVVGAGAAGIGAGRRLSAAGLDVLLVEARGRLGGRAYTDPDMAVAFDHGCSWLWGGPDNPLVEAANELGFHLEEDPGVFDIFFGAHKAQEADVRTFEALRDETLKRMAEKPEQAISEAETFSGPYAKALEANLGSWMMGEDAGRVSTREWGAVAPGARHTDLLVKEGLGTLITRLGQDLDVRLNTAVTSIDWSDRPVQVLSDQGLMTAKAVILTVSNGVLSSPGLRIRPHLPDRVHEALAGLPMGLLAKFLFVFEEEVFGLPANRHFCDAESADAYWVGTGLATCTARPRLWGSLAAILRALWKRKVKRLRSITAWRRWCASSARR